VRLLYFSWVRERLGKAEEQIEPPAGIATVSELMAWLARRNEQYAHAFENARVIWADGDHRPSPCAAGCADRGCRRDRILSAHDWWLKTGG
jgi:sulfur-carrier protein